MRKTILACFNKQFCNTLILSYAFYKESFAASYCFSRFKIKEYQSQIQNPARNLEDDQRNVLKPAKNIKYFEE